MIYIGLFSISAAGIFAIVLRGKFLVTLAQRSNVETPTLAFLFHFYTYIASLSWPGVFGSLKLIYCHLIYWGADRKMKLEAHRIETR